MLRAVLVGSFRAQGNIPTIPTPALSPPSQASDPDSLKTDLAIFGFFVALGRSTRLFLGAKGAAEDEATGGLLRYFEGGGVIFYPELARLPLYQLFVEVVCEEMHWLPFYPGEEIGAGGGDHGHGGTALPLASKVGTPTGTHSFARLEFHSGQDPIIFVREMFLAWRTMQRRLDSANKC